MKYEVITNFNFNNITSYQGPTPKYYDRKYGYYKEGDKIIFEANFVCCPCVYYIKKGDLFAFSFDHDLIVKFAKEHSIELTDTYENFDLINDNLKTHIKPSIKKRYKYNLNYIEKWKKIVLYEDGKFEIEENQFKPFQLKIADNFDKFYDLLLKYKNIISKLIDDKIFIPTITGGLDTRGFTWFYRERVNELEGYFLTSVKQDGKNHIEQGALEIKLSEQVAKKIGLKLKRIDNLEDYSEKCITLSGFFNENAESYENPNDADYIYKVIQHGYDNSHQYANKLTIFTDDDYLQFEADTMFKYIMLLLSNDLLHIPFVSGASLFRYFPDGCSVYPILKNQLYDAITIFENWGAKGKNIINN